MRNHIEVLEWMFIVKRIDPFIKNSAKPIGVPKLLMVDSGLACHLLGLKKTSQLLTSN